MKYTQTNIISVEFGSATHRARGGSGLSRGALGAGATGSPGRSAGLRAHGRGIPPPTVGRSAMRAFAYPAAAPRSAGRSSRPRCETPLR
ncbi:unnamed protein product [Pieris macdunnoughi]|uniref:Uncharacterized protein n=1 Tax=Pieris macdunnoughi TaxID=345717 RepID=A0A821QCS3_9NEOP|nr:unnamed protein product [Pieris macdunnoughi]